MGMPIGSGAWTEGDIDDGELTLLVDWLKPDLSHEYIDVVGGHGLGI